MCIRFLCFIILFVGTTNIQAQKLNKGQDKLFGVDINWEESAKNRGFIKKYLAKNSKKLHGTLDPDCVYKSVGNKLCGKSVDKKLLSKVAKLSNVFKKETGSSFNHVKKNKKRDFAGLSQGFVIDQIISLGKKGWAIDFAGDIYKSAPIKLSSKLYISDPILDPAPFATVTMKSGWMITSDLNENTNLNPKLKSNKRIKRVVLFGSDKMSGARLDAWSTAIIAGGIPKIRELLKIKKYKNLWGYLYFDIKDKPQCSSNIDCSIKGNANRKVIVNL